MSELKEVSESILEKQFSNAQRELQQMGFPLDWLHKVKSARIQRVLAEMKRRQKAKEDEAARILEQ